MRDDDMVGDDMIYAGPTCRKRMTFADGLVLGAAIVAVAVALAALVYVGAI